MESKIITKAKELKAKGFLRMASVVKSRFNTTYYHVVNIDDVIKARKWIPASFVTFPSGAHGRAGISGKQIDWSITARK